jgi:hypothetical protein
MKCEQCNKNVCKSTCSRGGTTDKCDACSKVSCDVCKVSCHPSEIRTCHIRKQSLCHECNPSLALFSRSSCVDCHKTPCSACFQKLEGCEECGEKSCCKLKEFLKECSQCSDRLCKKELVECGGCKLLFKHNDETDTLNYSQDQPDMHLAAYYLAFFTDCVHEILPVKSGYRVALKFNMFNVGEQILPPTSVNVSVLQNKVDSIIQHP